MNATDLVRWHDLECGGYDVDLELWRELAQEAAGPVLDVGAGTGRSTLDLARRGVDVTALDVEQPFLDELTRRAEAEGLTVPTLCSDARTFTSPRRFAAILVPMQTIQLLGGPAGRARFLQAVRAHLRPGGIFAAALADALEGYDSTVSEPPLPDMRDYDGWVYASRPIAVLPVATGMMIERIREIVSPGGERAVSEDRIVLDALTADTLYAECEAAGLITAQERLIPQTEEYVGSAVVVCRG